MQRQKPHAPRGAPCCYHSRRHIPIVDGRSSRSWRSSLRPVQFVGERWAGAGAGARGGGGGREGVKVKRTAACITQDYRVPGCFRPRLRRGTRTECYHFSAAAYHYIVRAQRVQGSMHTRCSDFHLFMHRLLQFVDNKNKRSDKGELHHERRRGCPLCSRVYLIIVARWYGVCRFSM